MMSWGRLQQQWTRYFHFLENTGGFQGIQELSYLSTTIKRDTPCLLQRDTDTGANLAPVG